MPTMPPPAPVILALPEWCGLSMCTLEEASRAAQAAKGVVDDVRIVGVKRSKGWRRETQLVSDLPLEMYVEYRLSVGGTREEATAEWRCARQLIAQ